MIYKDNLVTAWTDTPASLVKAACEAALSGRDYQVIRSDRWGSITRVMGEWFTTSVAVRDAALVLGYWVEPHLDGWFLLFGWPRDSGDPPNRQAIYA